MDCVLKPGVRESTMKGGGLKEPAVKPIERVLKIRVALDRPGRPLTEYLASRIRKVKPEQVDEWLRQGRVTLESGIPVDSSTPVTGGTVFRVRVPVPAHRHPQPMDFDVLYEDEHIVAIAKPAGVCVHPAKGNLNGTVFNGLLARYGVDARIRIVHRLDRDTSGVLVVGRSRKASGILASDFNSHRVRKRYLAIVDGQGPAEGWVEQPIGRDPEAPTRMKVTGDGRASSTWFRTLRQFQGPRYALVEALPRTGRTHQIRIHLAWSGCPIAADGDYHPDPGRASHEHGLALDRMALHAVSLSFLHPISHRPLHLEAPLAADFAESLARLEAISEGPDAR